MYRLFIDDERFPFKIDRFVIAQTSQEAFHLLVSRGVPNYISFDHDLGGEDTSMVFLKAMFNYMDDMKLKFPKNFDYHIHSQNPIGRENIRSYMTGLYEHIGFEEN